MAYVEGFVVPVPHGKKDAYLEMARKAAAIFKEHGATRVVECWQDDVPKGKITDFQGAVKVTDGEAVVFAWIEYPSRAARDAASKKVMEDQRMQPGDDMPFDMKRIIFGGFEVILDS